MTKQSIMIPEAVTSTHDKSKEIFSFENLEFKRKNQMLELSIRQKRNLTILASVCIYTGVLWGGKKINEFNINILDIHIYVYTGSFASRILANYYSHCVSHIFKGCAYVCHNTKYVWQKQPCILLKI